MSWSSARELKAQVLRRWERGECLRGLVSGHDGFPLRLTLKGPSSAELADRFEAVRAWIAELVAVPHWRIEWRELNHRVLGAQRVPQSVWLDSLDQALALIGKRADGERFTQLLARTRARQPALTAWLAKRPLQALELADKWDRLLAVVDWLQAHPRPGCYLRQVDLPAIDSKFIEAHRAILAEWLDLVLPPETIDFCYGGVGGFAARYGFCDKPVRIRFRVLDPAIASLPGVQLADITLDADNFARLAMPVSRVFITENETNFLAFPLFAKSMVIFGAGYGWEALSRAQWLTRCAIHYWGDIDTHGFAILDQLRGHFAQVKSFLMDRATLMAHQALWGEEAEPLTRDMLRLDPEERACYEALRTNTIRPKLRLEQERIGFGWVKTGLDGVMGNRESGIPQP